MSTVPWLAVVAPRPDDELEQLGTILEALELHVVQSAERLGEDLDPALAADLEDAPAFGGGLDANDTPVALIGPASNEARPLELAHNPGHRRRPDAFRRREIAEPDRAAEHDHRQCRQASGREAGRFVLAAQTPEEVDGRGVQPIGELELAGADRRLGARRDRRRAGRRATRRAGRARSPCILRHPNSMVR